jgi:hypothetical protein
MAKWGKRQRFDKAAKTDIPGPRYATPSIFDPGTSAYDNPCVPRYPGCPKSGKEFRAFWVQGHTKNDIAFRGDISAEMGPQYYEPRTTQTMRAEPRPKFSKEKRFMPYDKLCVDNELIKSANLANAGYVPHKSIF